MSDATPAQLLRARAFIDRHCDQPIDLAQLGAQAGFSQPYGVEAMVQDPFGSCSA